MGAGLWLQSVAGLLGICGLAWLASEDRPRRPWGLIAVGLGMQLLLALLLLRAPGFRDVINLANDAVEALTAATRAGSSFVFGYLGGAALPFEIIEDRSTLVIAFQILTLVIVVSALTSLLIHWRILPWVVRGFAALLERPFRLGGAAGLGMAANIFVGMVEAPLFIRDHLARLSRSDLFVVMCGGMATIAGTMFAVYTEIVEPIVPGAAGHLLTASVISAPAAIMIARLLVPPAPDAVIEAAATMTPPDYAGAMDAITDGTRTGLGLFLNIVAMLLVLVALVYLVNLMLGAAPAIGGAPLSLERIFGWVMAPLAWLMGLPWSEATAGGALLGTKTVLNEMLAYTELAALSPETLSPRSRLIMTYALCGFANFGSLGIMIGGLSSLVPERRAEIAGLGMKSILGGLLATCCTGGVVGLVGGA